MIFVSKVQLQSLMILGWVNTQALYVLTIQLYIKRSVNKVASTPGTPAHLLLL